MLLASRENKEAAARAHVRKPTSLAVVRFVLFKPTHLDIFRSALKELASSPERPPC